MIIYLNKICFDSIGGLAIWPFIFIRKDMHKNIIGTIRFRRLINHEKIHFRQQLELLIIPFYIWYLTEWCIKAYLYKSWNQGYREISFEREAYANDVDLEYFKKRKILKFLNYL